MKNILSVLTIVGAVFVLVFGGYYFRGNQEAQIVPNQGIGSLPSANNVEEQNAGTQSQGAVPVSSKLNKISEVQVLGYFADNGSNIFVIQPDGKVLRVSDGKTETLSNTSLAGLTSASFSYDGKKLMAFAGGSSSGSKINIFDVAEKSWSLIPNTAESPVWSPANHQIAFLSPVSGTNVIYSVDTDNSRARPTEIYRVHAEDLVISWPSASTMFLGELPNSAWSSSLWLLNPIQKTLLPVVSDRAGLEAAWSSSSTPVGLVFYSNANGQGGTLRLINKDGKQLQELNFLTFPSKCAFYDKPIAQTQATSTTASSSATSKTSSIKPQKYALTMVCAVPRDRQALDSSQLPDAYLQKSIFTSDNFFEIDISAGGEIKSVFNDQSKNFDADNLRIFNGLVFFVNRYDKKLYSIELPK